MGDVKRYKAKVVSLPEPRALYDIYVCNERWKCNQGSSIYYVITDRGGSPQMITDYIGGSDQMITDYI